MVGGGERCTQLLRPQPTAQAGSAEGQKGLGCSQGRGASGDSTQNSDRSLADGCGSSGDGKVPHGENLTQSIFRYLGISAGFFTPSYFKNVVLKDIAKCSMYSSFVSAKCSFLF